MEEHARRPRTPLHDRHVSLEARMGPDGGWEMPLSYGGPLDESSSVRNAAGILDLSHWGRIRVTGDEALFALERVCAGDLARQEDDTVRRNLLLTASGGILDAGWILRLDEQWLVLTAPENRQKVCRVLEEAADGTDARPEDITSSTVQLAVAGPAGAAALDAILPFPASRVGAARTRSGELMGAAYTAARIQTTGAWELHVVLPAVFARQAWDRALSRNDGGEIAPVGLAAWDILRIDAGTPRYGHELNETIDPVSAGLLEVVDRDRDFPGAEAVREVARRGPARHLAGLALSPQAERPSIEEIPRQGAVVNDPDGTVGTVTSGTWSPARSGPVALAYVATRVEPGTEVLVDTPAGARPAKVEDLSAGDDLA